MSRPRRSSPLATFTLIACAAAAAGAAFAATPVLVRPDYPLRRDALFERLRTHGILARRYFYPLISDFPMYHDMPSAAADNLPVARAASEQVICLPIHPALTEADVEAVIACVTDPAR